MLRKMHCKFFKSENIYYKRTICACLVAYSGFLRCSELLNIRCSDVCFEKKKQEEKPHMAIFIEKSKTDIYRDGQNVVIARTQTEL